MLGHIAVHRSPLFIAAVAAVGFVVAALGPRAVGGRSRDRVILATVFYGAMGFQVFHLLEHVLQAGYWVLHPTEAPWLTPWAVLGRDALAAGFDGRPGTGNELLHLVGNLIFFVGVIAGLLVVADRRPPPAGGRWLRRALWIQALHLAEHAALTITWLTVGQAHGVSTALGLLEPGSAAASGVRVWLHFLVNLAATAVALAGVREVRAAHQPRRAEPSSTDHPSSERAAAVPGNTASPVHVAGSRTASCGISAPARARSMEATGTAPGGGTGGTPRPPGRLVDAEQVHSDGAVGVVRRSAHRRIGRKGSR